MKRNHEILPAPVTDLTNSPGCERIEAINVLEPGYYWRAKINMEDCRVKAGDVLLLIDVFDFEGKAHSVTLLEHPRHGGRSQYKLLMADFLARMEPAADGETVREREQSQLLQEVADLQQEIAQAQLNPLQLPSVQEAANAAVEKAEREMTAEVARSGQDSEKKLRDLRRIHRRATRRSEAAGNPIVPRKVVLSNQLSTMLDDGVTPDGVRELAVEARRRAAIAEAAANVLTNMTRLIGSTMGQLAPFYAEKGQVAIARSKRALDTAKEMAKGIESLNLYTGEGVDVVTVREGSDALTHEPLTLIQGKRFMDEELAVYVDVHSDFDCQSQALFFQELSQNDRLLDQVMPFARCVVTMAVTRHDVPYGDMNPYEAAMRAMANQRVFLLVRNGMNVHAVYSSMPSHEAAARLFPLASEMEEPFRGIDGTRIGLNDVAFSAATAVHDAIALSYKRFLILLMGLDHRQRLMGEFYPPDQTLSFMSMEFQQRYFRFYEDDHTDNQLGEADVVYVNDWIAECNRAVRSGSRVLLLKGASSNAPYLRKRYGWELMEDALNKVHVASRSGKNHYVSVRAGDRRDTLDVKVWLDGEEAKSKASFLCLDAVRLDQVRRFIYSRLQRARSIQWLLLLRRVEHVLAQEERDQAELRSYLRQTALEHGGINEAQVDELMLNAISTWRATNRGAPAPAVSEIRNVHALLTLMFPANALAESLAGLTDALVQQQGLIPLQLVRTGRNGLALYVEASDADKAPYGTGCRWGWVKRLALSAGKKKLSITSSSLVWLDRSRPNAAETELRTWPSLEAWINETAEPVQLKTLATFVQQINEAAFIWRDILKEGRAVDKHAGLLPAELVGRLIQGARDCWKEVRYYEVPVVAIPLGVVQDRADRGNDVRFLYATASVLSVLQHYGTPEDVTRLKTARVSAGFRSNHVFRGDQVQRAAWRLVESSSLLMPEVASEGARAAKESHIRVIAQRRSPGNRGYSSARYNSDAILSFDRTLQTLLGTSRRDRKSFYENQRREFISTNTFPFNGSKRRLERRAAIHAWKFEPPIVAHHFSSLLMADGKLVGNRHFSTMSNRKRAEAIGW